MAKTVAAVMEFVWKTFRLAGHPPLYKGLINALGMTFIISDKKARAEIGYRPLVTIEQGLDSMRDSKSSEKVS
ncbi:hypothetical protein [Mucilaginibacter sp. R-33]|uniref:hypothetical protein n=1 Tax=Mucilaginibacter sp. R-33 TaxID=3416711 RepID=UPI003CF6AF14